ERRTHRSGKDSVDHPRAGSDDHANALFGLLRLCTAKFDANAGLPSWYLYMGHCPFSIPPGMTQREYAEWWRDKRLEQQRRRAESALPEGRKVELVVPWAPVPTPPAMPRREEPWK